MSKRLVLLAALLWLAQVLPAQARPECAAVPQQIRTMIDRDQALRLRVNQLPPGDTSLDAELLRTDTRHTGALKAIIRRCGWPDAARYDAPTARAAWLLAQHADHDVRFQMRVLKLIRGSIAGDADSRKEFAYLSDRISLKQKGKQVYGSQLMVRDSGIAELPPGEIDSVEAVDRRRAAIGLPGVAEYVKSANEKLARIRADRDKPDAP
ncbi:hypothetical protein Jab_1c05980 [Janthinobacterium sp. HH01]|uniref:DUF6624 domain-containing protein n=1 Tax=Janthinobacterium sp. HH01 TaxID=1198452 RepID=UPI0002AEDC31|nr:DUF6624 domain-containing protein [Janthinobacterium sp. HH01]ELX12009.1 hypothetical protein Jab_1c05980 [Janthinobacterium sp. HH01]